MAPNAHVRHMTITHVAERAGVTVETIRYYERHGLVQSGRDKRGRRRYSEHDFEQLEVVCILRDAGFSGLEILKVVLAGDRSIASAKHLAAARTNVSQLLAAMDARVAALEAARGVLDWWDDELDGRRNALAGRPGHPRGAGAARPFTAPGAREPCLRFTFHLVMPRRTPGNN
jgi:MerR family mercuric resistance operon transcriptional regulator